MSPLPVIPPKLHAQQNWRGSVQAPTATSGRSLLRIDLPVAYARRWTVHLEPVTTADGGAVASVVATELDLRWGSHDAASVARLSWPAAGGAFEVTGSFVEVGVVDTGVGLLRARISEGGPRPAAGRGAYFGAMFVARVGTIAGAGGAAVVPVPARARGYYMTCAELPTLWIHNVEHRVGATIIGVQMYQNSNNNSFAQPHDYYPFASDADNLRIVNSAGAARTEVRMHFLINLG